jgi:phospholipase/lecithinase/hemolysin
VGARASDLVLQVDAQVGAGGFPPDSLATVLMGTHDVLELFARYPGAAEAELIVLAQQRGELIAAQINRMVALGAKVIVSTVPDLGLSPYGLAQGADNAAVLSRLTAALNGRIRVNILNDGRYIGLLLADEFVQIAARSPGTYALTNVTTAACVAALPDCTTATLSAADAPTAWLWASDRLMGPGGHRQLGALAIARARSNPF